MRQITHLVVHCSATKTGQDISAADIRRWHLAQGWNDIGYHYVIRLDGTRESGRPLAIAGAHVNGHNKNTIGICLVGGLDLNGKPSMTFNHEQMHTLAYTLGELRAQFPNTRILGHRDFPGVKKDCPCFDVREWCVRSNIQP